MAQPLFFEPVFKERIWGGTHLQEFGYKLTSDQTGECWAFSAHPNGQSIVRNGEYKGRTLGSLWEEHRELFGNLKGDRFPLLTKILDANRDLSVQVHPDDTYAKTNENGELGKTECWYIIDCAEGAELIFGHHAETKEELSRLIDEGEWGSLLRHVKIAKGDFFYVPSGTVHALCEGTVVLETQQNSDTTYRLYDYDRTDAEGNLRELHLEKSKDVITVPHALPQVEMRADTKEGKKVTQFVKEAFFTVFKWEIQGEAAFEQNEPFLLCSVIEGEGILMHEGETYPLEKGDHVLLPADFGAFLVSGQLEIIAAHV
ncbi:mannose-6-phosphate isomerase, class I [Bacillus mangrovi]|uniref:Mannose-6-phosphate isomerase n=1 Tax=Metabacillus mangrovi TaxID=1491830 RepID=A0A7X2V504_9BACI|nr:mannose-6-phosphate isomerase, class I [Metabacillus mangrovi]